MGALSSKHQLLILLITGTCVVVQVHACGNSDPKLSKLHTNEEPCHQKWTDMASTSPRREAAVTDSLVTTAGGLIEALASGAAHIEIQDHLDFTQHKPRKGALGQNDTILVIPSTVKSIRGNCRHPMPSADELGLQGERLREQRPGQCLLTFAGGLEGGEGTLWATTVSTDQANTLWLDSLFMRAGLGNEAKEGSSAALFGAFRMHEERDKIRAGPSVFLTRVTLQGSRRAPVVALAATTRVLVQDSELVDVGEYYPPLEPPSQAPHPTNNAHTAEDVWTQFQSPVVLALNETTAVFRDCKFSGVRAVHSAVISHQLGVAGVQLERCMFEDNDAKYNLGTWAGGEFFSDTAQDVHLMHDNTTLKARPLSDAASHGYLSFLSTEDANESFLRLVEELETPVTGSVIHVNVPPGSGTHLPAGPLPHHLQLAVGWTAVIILVAVAAWKHIAHERQLQQRQYLLAKTVKSTDV